MKYIDYICAILIRGVNLIFHFLPIQFTLWLGRRFGIIVYHVNKTRKVIGYANLRAAFCEEKSPHKLKKLIKEVYRSLVETFFEILSLTKVNKKYIDRYVEIVNAEDKYRLMDNPRGIIFLTAHFGNWELSGMTSAIKGFPLVVLAREQKMKRLNELINKLRESKGLKIVRKGITTRYIVKALHKGKIIGMLGDQDAGKSGVFAEFFGRPASTAPGTARIAAKTGAYILPVFMARKKGPYHRLVLEDAVKIEKKEDVTLYLEKYNKLLEKYVRMNPTQWLWLHKRWKSSPLKKVVILNDGRAGHLNQSLAAGKLLKKYREDSGYKNDDTRISVIDIKFKNKFLKALLNFLSLFSDSNCQGCMKCLKFSLTKGSYDDLMKRYADIVISCGSGLAGVNRFFAIENNAKNACIMKPSFLGTDKFNMVVLPRHDTSAHPKRDNVIITDTVPNLIDEEYLTNSSKHISGMIKLEKQKRIGVLLGGDNSEFTLTGDLAEEMLANIIDASNRLDAEILFSTSRRTPKEAEQIVKNTLRAEKRCKLAVIANEENIPDAAAGILGLADIVVVSGESASMISEAIQSGKKVIVFRLKKKHKKNSKFEKMLDNLAQKGFISIAEVEKLSGAICRSAHISREQSLPLDRKNLYMHMWRLL